MAYTVVLFLGAHYDRPMAGQCQCDTSFYNAGGDTSLPYEKRNIAPCTSANTVRPAVRPREGPWSRI